MFAVVAVLHAEVLGGWRGSEDAEVMQVQVHVQRCRGVRKVQRFRGSRAEEVQRCRGAEVVRW